MRDNRECKDIYVYIEQRRGIIQSVAIELIGEAKRLAKDLNCKVIGILVGKDVSNIANETIHWGLDEVIVVEKDIFENYTTEAYAKAIAEVIKSRNPEIVLYGATSIGRDLAPRISAKLGTGLTADCTDLKIDEETKNLLMTRPAFGGNIMATIVCENHRPQMATVRGGVMQRWIKDIDREGLVTRFETSVTKDDIELEIIEVVQTIKESIDITKAEIIVSGGRGIGSKENFEILKETAKALGGEVAASRAAVDEGWMPKEVQVGQTGTTVRPKIYIACAISGAIQHVAGMENSDYIIAINKDNEAQIFNYADLGIVGDYKKVLPELTKQLLAQSEEAVANA